MKEILQPEISEARKRLHVPRVALALAAATILTGFDLINRFVSAEEMQSNTTCSVGVNIRGVEFIDIGGERGFFDPGIDKEVGVAGNFIAKAISSDKVRELARVDIGSNGQGIIRGIQEQCNTVGPNGRPALGFYVGTENNVYIHVVAEDGFAAKVVVGRQVDDKRSDVPRGRRDSDFDRDTDSDTDSNSSSRSDSRSQSSIDIDFPDKIKTEIINDPLKITGTLDIKGPLEVRLSGLNFNETVRQEDGRVITGTVIGLRPEPPDLRNWRWWPWLIIPAVIAGGLAGLGAFLGGRKTAVNPEETHVRETHTAAGTRPPRETTTRRETRRAEGVAEETAEGTRTRETRETRTTRETRETP